MRKHEKNQGSSKREWKKLGGKKAQLELLGLAVIVILVTMGILFTVKFMAGKQPRQLQESYEQKAVAQSTLSAMMTSVSADCQNLDIGSLLQDCVNNRLQQGSILCENGMRSCPYVEEALKYMLENTLRVWERSYRFRAYLPGEPLTMILPRPGDEGNPSFNPFGCTDDTEKEAPGIQPIPLEAGTLTVILEICQFESGAALVQNQAQSRNAPVVSGSPLLSEIEGMDNTINDLEELESILEDVEELEELTGNDA